MISGFSTDCWPNVHLLQPEVEDHPISSRVTCGQKVVPLPMLAFYTGITATNQ